MGAETGQVAPDFKPKTHFNTLRVKPEYRMTLEMGPLEDLFKNDPGTPEGRMERLQVLGLNYFPLKHPKAKDRLPAIWDWVKTKIFGAADDAAADAAIQTALKCRVVSGALPPGFSDAPTGLPTDAADPADPKPENFAKIRIPGGYTVQSGAGAGSVNMSGSYPAKFSDNKLFGFESKFYDDNPALRKIPLVAKVEKRLKPDDPWSPAEGVAVHFQLLTPYAYDKPAFDATAASSQQFQRPPLGESRGGPTDAPPGAGPKKKIDAEEGAHAAPTDPQGINAYKSRGGQRGNGSLSDCSDVAGPIFTSIPSPDSTRRARATCPINRFRWPRRPSRSEISTSTR